MKKSDEDKDNDIIKTKKIPSDTTVENILGKDNLLFLVTFGKNGEVIRFVPDTGCKGCFEPLDLDYPIPTEEIENAVTLSFIKAKANDSDSTETEIQTAVTRGSRSRRKKCKCKYLWNGKWYCCDD